MKIIISHPTTVIHGEAIGVRYHRLSLTGLVKTRIVAAIDTTCTVRPTFSEPDQYTEYPVRWALASIAAILLVIALSFGTVIAHR